MLMIYNSLTRSKLPFTPMQPGKIGMYVCGITVYDHCHLGHARSMVCFDMIVRYLRAKQFEVTYVRNITDVDDKIINRAQERGVAVEELTAQYIDSMHEDARALNVLPPDREPRATTHIATIIQLIERLVEQGYAYVNDSGDVCYDIKKFDAYGKLSGKDLEKLKAGVRIAVDPSKRSPWDFVLWKKAKPSEPAWSSPWGEGRPGWHIECSAMSMEELGEQFDIHGGGLDLQFPHHENEIAQSEGASGKPFANYWMHVGLLQVNKEKMAKSTGNFATIKDVLKKHNPEVVRYFLLSSHYRSPLNYSEDSLQEAKQALTRLYRVLNEETALTTDAAAKEIPPIDQTWINAFNEVMDDDFNTPMALSVLFQLASTINKTKNISLIPTLKYLASFLGLLQTVPAVFLQAGSSLDGEETAHIEALINQRIQAKQAKDWKRADEIRSQLTALGIELQDTPEGTSWRKKE
ncbi:MAG: cysteine--tRNA ligase [Legionella sp.]|nr:cysteine--tRNA ligase [Legionella sp.]